MRCHSCRRLTLSTICMECRNIYIRPKPNIRVLSSGLEVLSFFSYDEIEPFLLTKHYPSGWFIYRILARETFRAVNSLNGETVASIPIDDTSHGGYSHTAILAKELKKYGFKPIFNVMTARNKISYSGRSLSYRLENPRGFVYNGPVGIEAVLVDDIVTTGLTLMEAQRALEKNRVKVGQAIVIADVDR